MFIAAHANYHVALGHNIVTVKTHQVIHGELMGGTVHSFRDEAEAIAVPNIHCLTRGTVKVTVVHLIIQTGCMCGGCWWTFAHWMPYKGIQW